MRILVTLVVNWVILMVVAGFLDPYFRIDGVATAFLAAVILSLMNGIVKPILIFFTLPITVLTMGLFLLVINAVTLLLTAALIEGFTIDGFGYAFLAGIIVSILNFLIQRFIVSRW